MNSENQPYSGLSPKIPEKDPLASIHQEPESSKIDADQDAKAAVISQVLDTFPNIILARAQYLGELHSIFLNVFYF